MKHTKRLKIIKAVFAVIVILLLFVPASVSHPQIDMRALVAALGIDAAENDKIEVSVEIILPVEGGGSRGSSEVISGSAATLSEALSSIGISLGRQLELNHCGIVVLGQDYAKRGVTKELEYLLSSGIVCPEINLTVSANETANEFLQELSGYSQKLDLSNLLRYTDLGVQNYSRPLVHFVRDCRSNSATGAVPCFKMGYRAENSAGSISVAEFGDKSSGNKEASKEPEKESEKESGKEASKESSTKESGSKESSTKESGSKESSTKESGSKESSGEEAGKKNEDDKQQSLIENAKMTAVFKSENGNAVLKQILPDEETYGLAWLDKRTKKGYVFVDGFTEGGKTVSDIPLIINGKKIKKRVKREGGKVSFIVDVNVKVKIEDRHSLNALGSLESGIIPNKVKEALKKKAGAVIAGSIKKAYSAAKEEGADVMMIEDLFYRKKNRDYKALKADNYDFLANTEFVVNCSVEIN